MGFYEDKILPRLVDLALGSAQIGKLRERALAGISGTVLEVGFGSGTNLPHYPPEVERILAVDPAVEGRKLARKRVAASDLEVEFIGLDGQHLPLEDESVDNIACTWTLCTIPDAELALTEMRRVLRPGGRLYYLEHGRSDDAKVAARQDRFDGIQQRIAGGCHLNRDHESLIRAAGFSLESNQTFQIAGPKALSFMYAGVARR